MNDKARFPKTSVLINFKCRYSVVMRGVADYQPEMLVKIGLPILQSDLFARRILSTLIGSHLVKKYD